MAYPADPVHLSFPSGHNAHVNHGLFWVPGISLGQFYADAWCAPTTGAEYIISGGYGGAHPLLFGFNGLGGLTGNVYNGSASTDFFGEYAFTSGEWCHVACAWNGTSIYTYVNGVPAGRTAFAGPRQAYPGDGFLFVGGSDHSNFFGNIGQVRIFEDTSALNTMNAAFRPDRPFGLYAVKGGVYIPASFLATYMGPGPLTIADASAGYEGVRHPGNVYAGGKSMGLSAVEALTYPYPSWAVDTNSPFRSDSLPTVTQATHTPPATPGSARIFDSFSRDNQTYAFQAAPSLGSTEAGSLGALAWTTAIPGSASTSPWGILGGRAVFLGQNAQVAYVDNGQADMDVRIDRRNSSTLGLHHTGLNFRMVDKDNFWAAFTSGATATGITVTLNIFTAGAPGANQNFTAPATTWTTLRVVASGTTITVYVDNGAGGWTQIGQLTGQTTHQAGTKAGQFAAGGAESGLLRFDNFTVL